MTLAPKTELLFSYGTLQLTPVQIETFGRPLTGAPDMLIGWQQGFIEITDPEVLRKSGERHHPIVTFTGQDGHFVLGTVFEITKAELAHADAYEVDDYERVEVNLKSGKTAWLYAQKSAMTD